jgi:hypothetical protein
MPCLGIDNDNKTSFKLYYSITPVNKPLKYFLQLITAGKNNQLMLLAAPTRDILNRGYL